VKTRGLGDDACAATGETGDLSFARLASSGSLDEVGEANQNYSADALTCGDLNEKQGWAAGPVWYSENIQRKIGEEGAALGRAFYFCGGLAAKQKQVRHPRFARVRNDKLGHYLRGAASLVVAY
jgi:hypothetical protein